ncbi:MULTISPECIES: acyl-CoA dehydrogenase [unclassified Streptomyces]|uniref:acyl-CoA dehydrogenase n=1 Tax=unclassified Streptomyces TaxID=2593676 RepID=UPI001EF83592|nr:MULTISPECIES: acyl-CoA dehydrogenase [unclassified Streptomyces]
MSGTRLRTAPGGVRGTVPAGAGGVVPVAVPVPVAALPVRDRVAALERLLGDPGRPDNPTGHRALLRADRAATPSAEAEAVLDGFGMNEEFVPRELGGRFDSVESLVRIARPVFRRDVALGTGHGTTTFTAASDVWMAGSADQRAHLAALLLAGSKAAVAEHESARTGDSARSGIRIVPRAGGGLALTGAKPVVTNVRRADALVLFCRTGDERGSGSHSALLLDPRRLPADRHRITGRPPSVGLRGYFRSGVEFDRCPVPEGALLGAPGSGLRTALRSFQISRTLTASLAVAAGDTALRTAVRVDRAKGPGGAGGVGGAGGLGGPGTAADPRQVAATVTGAFTDLLLCDSLALVAARALHLLPGETSLYAAAAAALLPKVLSETMHDLSTVLGSQLYAREGAVGIFAKHLRDVPAAGLGHAGAAACRATVVPQLGSLARGAWFTGEEAPAALFRPAGPLPPFRYGALVPAGGRDSLSASLLAFAAAVPGTTREERALRAPADLLVRELRDLRGRVLALPPPEAGRPTSPAWFALGDRHALVLAGAAVLGVWWHARAAGDAFLGDPSWAAAALHRVARRLGLRPGELPASCADRVHREVLARFGEGRSYDLYDAPVPG